MRVSTWSAKTRSAASCSGTRRREASPIACGSSASSPQDRLAAILADADLYVQSSLHEAAGVSVLEAAAAGLPIVGTRVGYVADWASDRALAVESMSASAMARAHSRVARQIPSRARAMAAKAQAWALEHHASWVADRFAALYREHGEAGV